MGHSYSRYLSFSNDSLDLHTRNVAQESASQTCYHHTHTRYFGWRNQWYIPMNSVSFKTGLIERTQLP